MINKHITMISKTDIEEMGMYGIPLSSLEYQIDILNSGIIFQEIDRAATIGDGIKILNSFEKIHYNNLWQKWNAYNSSQVERMIPASGAATRMFKILHEYVRGKVHCSDPEIMMFFKNIKSFAFYDKLNEVCINLSSKSILQLIEENQGILVCKYLLSEEGLSYGLLPKGLLYFHRDNNGCARTPVNEHIIEACQYSEDNEARVHFSVSKSFLKQFEEHVYDVTQKDPYLKGKKLKITLSVQKNNTDTLALDNNGKIVRDLDGHIILRPGGHGALIENLNEIRADIVFIRNIDNIAPTHKTNNSIDRGAMAGYLISKREQIFDLINKIKQNISFLIEEKEQIESLLRELNIEIPLEHKYYKELLNSLNRPIRVCGMVKNTGEAGGGPFWVKGRKASNLLILEMSQIDLNDESQIDKVNNATHFNPVDMVCSITDYKGDSFDLMQYVDPKQAFVVNKSFRGENIKAIELPGLWNGAMANWITIFVDLPLSQFTPVKTVNDLLRVDHL